MEMNGKMVRCRFCSISSVDRPDGYFKVDGKWVLVKWKNWVCPKCSTYYFDVPHLWKTARIFNYQDFEFMQSKLFARVVAEYGATMGKIAK